MPEYPGTSESGVAHFIHCSNPFPEGEPETSVVRKILTNEMSKVCISVHLLYITRIDFIKVQFSLHARRDMNITRLLPLSKSAKDKNGKAYHRSYECGGIHHCEYAHPDILRVCEAYDQVKLENINDLRRNSSRPSHSIPVDERNRKYTERYSCVNLWDNIILYINIYSFYYAFMSVWREHESPCIYQGTRVPGCAKQEPTMFRRNNVSTFQMCTRKGNTNIY
jgi:hypothetical protein